MTKANGPKTPRCPTKWSSGNKNRASLPCKAVGSEDSYQLSLPPGSAITGLKLSATITFGKPIVSLAPPGGRQNNDCFIAHRPAIVSLAPPGGRQNSLMM